MILLLIFLLLVLGSFPHEDRVTSVHQHLLHGHLLTHSERTKSSGATLVSSHFNATATSTHEIQCIAWGILRIERHCSIKAFAIQSVSRRGLQAPVTAASFPVPLAVSQGHPQILGRRHSTLRKRRMALAVCKSSSSSLSVGSFDEWLEMLGLLDSAMSASTFSSCTLSSSSSSMRCFASVSAADAPFSSRFLFSFLFVRVGSQISFRRFSKREV